MSTILQPGGSLGLDPTKRPRISETVKEFAPRIYPRIYRQQQTVPQIKHWIMIFQENRTFDMYFHGYPGANSYDGGVAVSQQSIGGCSHNQGPCAKSWNKGKMDPNDFKKNGCKNVLDYFPSNLAGISDYWKLAGEFTLCDNFFSSWMGPSLTNHILNISASHGPCTDKKAAPNGWVENNTVPAPFSITAKNICDLLLAAGVSFRYYGTLGNYSGGGTLDLWAVLNRFATFNDYKDAVVPDVNILTDVTGPEADFPEVAWVIPPGVEAPPGTEAGCWSEHPNCGPAAGFTNWTGPIVAKIMANTDLWNSCAILLTYDDWGGYYDHVAPPSVSPTPIPPPPEQVQVSGDPKTYWYGLRAPAMIISPYAKAGFVDHTQYDFTSFLKTLEVQYNLPSLGGLDTVANDFFSNSPFNAKQAPRRIEELQSFRRDLADKKAPRRVEKGRYRHATERAFGEEIESW